MILLSITTVEDRWTGQPTATAQRAFAAELHDGVLQDLFTTRLDVDELLSSADLPDPVRTLLTRVAARLDSGSNSIRSLVFDLYRDGVHTADLGVLDGIRAETRTSWVVEVDDDGTGDEPRVVLVDDHPLVLEGLARALHRRAMNVVGTFVDAPSALSFRAAHEVNLLVVDLRLGEQSGVSLIGEARRRYPGLKIALLTSFEEPRAAAAAVRAGASGVLIKASASAEICRQLREVARGALLVDARLAAAVLTPRESLSAKEIAVLNLVADGLTNRGIGERLHLSHHTVKDYLAGVMRKLGVSTRAEAVGKAIREGLC
ncbi:MAG: response regulator [Haloechinothrix sp.]